MSFTCAVFANKFVLKNKECLKRLCLKATEVNSQVNLPEPMMCLCDSESQKQTDITKIQPSPYQTQFGERPVPEQDKLDGNQMEDGCV